MSSLLQIAVDLNRSMSTFDRYDRFLDVIRQVIPCDAACLMSLKDSVLEPLAGFGLKEKVMSMHFPLSRHPRLKVICHSEEPVIFPPDSDLADPFDNMIAGHDFESGTVHSCLGCPLTFDRRVIGVLAADALRPEVFDGFDYGFLRVLGALAGSVLNTSRMIVALEETSRKQRELANDLLRTAVSRSGGELVGQSPVMGRLRSDIDAVAASNFSVLITGESGTGKELVAHALHAQSKRAHAPLIYVNCAALPENLAESELFGHVKGAFTGADQTRVGKFQVADGGTLFLDEIGELPLSIQPKLLRALQEGEVQQVGSNKIANVDTRVIAATNRQLEREVQRGTFRIDLFHRLNVYPIQVPPLRDRPEDIDSLTLRFIDIDCKNIGLNDAVLAPETRSMLHQFKWPGNVRELRNVISRALLKAASESQQESVVLKPHHLGLDVGRRVRPDAVSTVDSQSYHSLPLRDAVNEFQKGLIIRTVERCDGNWSHAAQLLAMDRGNLHHLAQRLGLK